jgi:CRP/FNR family cyclic AMP-dependent transcriptional regulator
MKIMNFLKRPSGESSGKSHRVSFLQDCPIFKDLLPEEIERFLSIAREVNYHESESIMVEGQEGDTMYIILNGTVDVSKSLTLKVRGSFVEHEKTLIRLSADDHAIFGEVVLFDQNTRTASITAVTDCNFLEIRREDFYRFADANPSIGYRITRNIAKIICERFRKTDQDTIRLTTALSIALSRR